LGIRSEAVDALNPGEKRSVRILPQHRTGLKKRYTAAILCDLIHAESAQVMAVFDDDFYKGYPALTCNRWGKGRAYYLAAMMNDPFPADFYGSLLTEIGIRCAFPHVPCGVSLQTREIEGVVFRFVMNFSEKRTRMPLPKGVWEDLVSGHRFTHQLPLEVNAVHILRELVP
jgi:beta-galactosidase